MAGQTPKKITTDRQAAAFAPPEGSTKDRRAVTNRGIGGLALEVRTDRNAKAWLYRFRIAGKQHEMTLGSYPSMRLAAAREAHRGAAELVGRGVDPRKHRMAVKATNEAAWTMAEAFERWMEFYTTAPARGGNPPTERTVAKQRGRWRLHLDRRLGSAYVRDITRRQLIDVLEDVASVAREEGRQCLTLLRHLLDYCEDREQIDDNPAAGLKPAKIKARPGRPRERHLKLPELRELWQSIEDARTQPEGLAATAVLSPTAINAIKLLILTGARRAEVAEMRWAEVKRDTWTIPPERAKSRREHKVHLSSLALEILAEQRQYSAGEHVFESMRKPGQPIHYDSITTAVARLQGRNRKEHDTDAPLNHLEHFTVHDLRRSVATLWTETFMADPLLVDAMLAHVPPRLMGTYNKGKRYQMQVDVWNRWGGAVADMIARDPGSNI